MKLRKIVNLRGKEKNLLKKEIENYFLKSGYYLKEIAKDFRVSYEDIKKYSGGKAFSFIEDKKRCSICGIHKDLDNFYPDKSNRYGARCIPCEKRVCKNRRIINKNMKKPTRTGFAKERHGIISPLKRRVKNILNNKFRIVKKKIGLI